MRTLSVRQMLKFYKEFPFLETVLDQEVALDTKHMKLKVHVQVMDAASLYKIPRYCLSPNYINYIRTIDGKLFVGQNRPMAYAFNNQGIMLKSFEWNYNQKDRFLKEVITRETKTVVLVNRYTWWRMIEDWLKKGFHTCVGDYSHHEYEIIIFKEPKEGFANLMETSCLYSNVPINDLLPIGMAAYHGQTEASMAEMALQTLVMDFKTKIGADVWKRINEVQERRMFGVFGQTELRTFICAERIMLSFRLDKDQITFVGDKKNHRNVGLQSLNGSVDMAKRMINQVIENWNPETLVVNENISMI